MQNFVIDGRLPGANEYIDASHNHYKRSKLKRCTEDKIIHSIKDAHIHSYNSAIDIIVFWFEKPTRNGKVRDKDNIMFGIKFILDAMQTAEIIPNDDWDYINSITHYVSKADDARINVYLNEVAND